MTDLKKLLIAGILLLAFALRFYGVNWDQNQHLHPDERFLTMVTEAIDWPADIPEYFDTAHSPLNPHNRGFGFFVYGTFPVFLTKYIAELLGKADYTNLTLVGRQVSALFDLGTVIMVFFISSAMAIKKRHSKEKNYLPMIAMFIYSLYVLPIQLSHFYAVDTFLVFFLTVTFYLNQKIMGKENNYRKAVLYILMGFSLGLAFTSKISAILILPALLVGQLFVLIKSRQILKWLAGNVFFVIVFLLTVRIFQPYAFKGPSFFDFPLNIAALDNWKQLKALGTPNSSFPPAIQWLKTKAYIFPLKNFLLWGAGLPLGLMAIVSYFFLLFNLIKAIKYNLITFWSKKGKLSLDNDQVTIILLIIWVATVFIYEGMQFAKTIRYLYPIYPPVAIVSAVFLNRVIGVIKKRLSLSFKSVLAVTVLIVLVYPISFMSIYSRPHTRVAASYWVYENLPFGSAISAEHWDDFVPLSLPQKDFIQQQYKGIEFPLYAPDSKEKWILMEGKLKETDYIILTSNRLYGAIMTVPERYPVTFRYYKSLFNGSLGFEKIAEFTSRPNISIPLINLCLTPPFTNYGWIALKDQECPLSGISFVDDYADEAFTVYDHPKVLIFKKVKQVDYLDVLGM